MSQTAQGSLLQREKPTIIAKFDEFPTETLAESFAACDPGMIQSVKNFGVLAPLILIPDDASSAYKYKVCDGLRRLYAAQRAGVKTVPAIVYNMDPTTSDASTVMLNQKRTDNPVAELQAIERVMSRAIGDVEISKATGIPIGKIRKLLKYRLLIPELRRMFDEYRLSAGVAARIVGNDVLLSRQEEIFANAAKTEGKILSKNLDAMLEAKRKEDQQPLLGDAAFAAAAPGSASDAAAAALAARQDVPYEKLLRVVGNAMDGYGDAATHPAVAASGPKVFVANAVRAYLVSKGVRVVDPPEPVSEEPAPPKTPEPAEEDPERVPDVPPADEEEEYFPEGEGQERTPYAGVSSDDLENPFFSEIAEALGNPSIGKGVAEKIVAALGVDTLEKLSMVSVWTLCRCVDGIGKQTAEKLHAAGLLHDHYDPEAKTMKGYAYGETGQRVQATNQDEPQYFIDRVHPGEKGGGLSLRRLDGSDLAFWTWEKLERFYRII
jgi:ParB/RepB/Spo0J family partition protein